MAQVHKFDVYYKLYSGDKTYYHHSKETVQDINDRSYWVNSIVREDSISVIDSVSLSSYTLSWNVVDRVVFSMDRKEFFDEFSLYKIPVSFSKEVKKEAKQVIDNYLFTNQSSRSYDIQLMEYAKLRNIGKIFELGGLILGSIPLVTTALYAVGVISNPMGATAIAFFTITGGVSNLVGWAVDWSAIKKIKVLNVGY
jgi:hypothetical protein